MKDREPSACTLHSDCQRVTRHAPSGGAAVLTMEAGGAVWNEVLWMTATSNNRMAQWMPARRVLHHNVAAARLGGAGFEARSALGTALSVTRCMGVDVLEYGSDLHCRRRRCARARVGVGERRPASSQQPGVVRVVDLLDFLGFSEDALSPPCRCLPERDALSP